MHTKALLDVQAGMLDHIQALRESEVSLRAQIDTGKAPEVADEQLDRLFELLQHRHVNSGDNNESHQPAALEGDDDTPAVVKLLEYLSLSSQPVTKDDLDHWISNLSGYEGTTSQLRFNTMAYGFVGFSLTEKGRRRLQRELDGVAKRDAV